MGCHNIEEQGQESIAEAGFEPTIRATEQPRPMYRPRRYISSIKGEEILDEMSDY